MNYYLQGNFKIYLSLIFHQLQFNLLYFKEISKKKNSTPNFFNYIFL
ncbi:hypothetical protein DES35_102383 [Schleiferia thermophila]|uniref:Uncharacterized protein n=1 Tax=Schleiferia thermophila TaxID=884107 RepID=A0A369A6G5_9FLAO|nr:hypothetical protein DES35_102383 [Schleiferia thermophila]